MPESSTDQWYTRPVLFVKDVAVAMNFYCNRLGFKTDFDYQSNQVSIVAQVSRGEKCELLLAENVERAGHGRVFIELEPEELARFRRELEKKDLPVTQARWGMPVLALNDPDGNELFFPLAD